MAAIGDVKCDSANRQTFVPQRRRGLLGLVALDIGYPDRSTGHGQTLRRRVTQTLGCPSYDGTTIRQIDIHFNLLKSLDTGGRDFTTSE